jgi:hypothetical protein
MAERIVFSRSLYAPEAVEAAAKAFGELAKIDVSIGEDIEVSLSDPDPDLADVLADELANHALALTVRQARGTA